MKNPAECWSAGILGRWSNLTTLHPVRRNGCRILEQKQTKETKRQSRFEIGTSLSSFASVQNPSPNQAQSSLIKPNQAISCLDAIQSQPPSCSKIATSPILLRQSQSKPVKMFLNRYLQATIPATIATYCGFPSQMHNPLWFAATAYTNAAAQSAISVKPRQMSPIRPIRQIRPIHAIRPVLRSLGEGGNPPSFAEPTEGRQSAINSRWTEYPVRATFLHV